MKTEKHTIDGRDIFVSAVSVFVGGHEKLAGAWKLDEPPAMIGGEFVKDGKGKTALFNTQGQAIEAAIVAYREKTGGLG